MYIPANFGPAVIQETQEDRIRAQKESEQKKNTKAQQEAADKLLASDKASDRELGALYASRAGTKDDTDMASLLQGGLAGQLYGNQVFGEGSLGRVSEGFSSQESQALRRRAQQDSSNASRQAARQLKIAQASSGMSGGAAVFQQGQLQNERAMQQAAVNRDLFLAEEAQRRQDIEFNLQQAAREKAGRLSSTLGFMQMQQGLLTANKAAQAVMNAPGGNAGGGGGGLISSILGKIF